MPTYATVSADLVERLLREHDCSREDLNAIRDPRRPSKYSGTYSHVHGSRYTVHAYRARVFKFWELGSWFESPEHAARAVVSFYKAYFGARWRVAFRNRRLTPWRIRPVSGGYAIDLFVRGVPVGVTRADAGEGRSGEWVWPDVAAARAAARVAMARRFEKEKPALPVPAPGLVFWRG